MSDPVVVIDGQLVERPTISIFDRGFLYGDGLFEVLRTWDGEARDLDAHLDRMGASAEALQLPFDRARIADDVRRAIGAAGEGDYRLRILITRGPGPIGARFASLGGDRGHTIVIAEPLGSAPASVSLAIVDYPLPRRSGAAHKTLAYLDHLIARELAASAGADEAVRLGPDGDVVECATANLFIVTAGGGPEGVGTPTVATPASVGILPGITRRRVLEACAAAGIPAVERRISVEELRAADEIFVTSSVRGVVPVTSLDGVARPEGALTKRIAAALHATGQAARTP